VEGKKGDGPNGTVVHQILVTWRRWEIASLIQLHALCYPNSAIRAMAPFATIAPIVLVGWCLLLARNCSMARRVSASINPGGRAMHERIDVI
jgi:hypothetical protein